MDRKFFVDRNGSLRTITWKDDDDDDEDDDDDDLFTVKNSKIKCGVNFVTYSLFYLEIITISQMFWPRKNHKTAISVQHTENK